MEAARPPGREGQTGLAIIAPIRGQSRVATDGDGTVLRVLRRDETPAAGEHEARTPWMRGFTVEKVFSAEQTSGEAIPEPPSPRLLVGEAPRGLGEAVMRLIESRGFTVSTVPAASYLQGANGLTTFSAKSVQLRADMDDAAMVKTLIHEAAHLLLHMPDRDAAAAPIPRAHAEVEAESVAFIVARVRPSMSRPRQTPFRDHDSAFKERKTQRRGPRLVSFLFLARRHSGCYAPCVW